MRKNVFLSYSWDDSQVAIRLYDDLTDSNILVWRDQIDGCPTSDFEEEFLSKIDDCDYFIMLDSKNYRKKSRWCIKEIERCFDNFSKENPPTLIVCLLEEDGDWRQATGVNSTFEKVNRIKYFPFYFDGAYDNERIYYKSLSEICSIINPSGVKWNKIPEIQDLEEEILASSQNARDFKSNDRNSLIKTYEVIKQRICNMSSSVSDYFDLWISDCKEYGLHLLTPRLAYSIWMAQEYHHGRYDDKCYALLKQLLSEFPSDIRLFRAIGAIAARLNKYDEALDAYMTSLSLIESRENRWHKSHSEFSVLCNLGQLYLNKQNYSTALHYFLKASDLIKNSLGSLSSVCLSVDRCYAELGYPLRTRIEYLLSFKNIFSMDADFLETLALLYEESGDNIEAMRYMNRSYLLHPSPEMSFFLLQLAENGSVELDGKNLIISNALNSRYGGDEDLYWQGAICFYILNNRGTARSYFEKIQDQQNFCWYH